MKKKIIVVLIIGFLLSIGSLPAFAGSQTNNYPQSDAEMTNDRSVQETVAVTCYTIGVQGKQTQQGTLSLLEAETLNKKILVLQTEIASNPTSETIQQLQQEIIRFASEHHLLPNGVSPEKILTQITTQQRIHSPLIISQPLISEKASEFLCNFATTGSGSTFPIIILPRLIPILLMPIPRAFVRWSTPEGITSVGGLRSGTGFIAIGDQKGIALGFWGIGFSIFLPPVAAYGLFGYALYAQVTAEKIEYWPPNNPPLITGVDPTDGEINVPLSTSEVQFQIEDLDGDLMSYTVTTSPDIGSGSGGLKTDGIYTVPISGLQSFTEYSWTITVDDGKDVVEKTMMFTTAPVEPMVLNPIPLDGAREIPSDLSELQFHLTDVQGDQMDYTVETSPDIGSGNGMDVGNGTYAIVVSGVTSGTQYYWYVNVTDGAHWTRKMFTFETGFPSQFNPFEYGWGYRKRLTVAHACVAGNLTSFPLLVQCKDIDLAVKALSDGKDILFMAGDGVAPRLYHELEWYDHTTGDLVAWVNVPTLSTTTDTILYMYYGNPASIDLCYPERVWTGDYAGVWHLSEGGIDIRHDSTYYKRDLEPQNYDGDEETIGKIAAADELDGIDDYACNSDTSHYLDGSQGTFEAWINPYTFTPEQVVVGKHQYSWAGWKLNLDMQKLEQRYWYGGPPPPTFWRDVTSPDQVWSGMWCHVVATRGPAGLKIYRNGIEIASNPAADPFHEFGNGKLAIGAYGDGNYFFNGGIDEVRVSLFQRNIEWIRTEYNNQNDPASFLLFGPEEPG